MGQCINILNLKKNWTSFHKLVIIIFSTKKIITKFTNKKFVLKKI
jgi:hypothetical protein